MKLIPPFPLSTIVQGFGQNAVSAYAGMGLKGHPGIDFSPPWGTPIPCATDSFCYSNLSKDYPNLMSYRAVCTIVDEADVSYEIIYGHDSDIFAVPFTQYQQGYILANIGNTGDVYVDGREVTNAEKMAGSHAGAHLHFQVRIVKRMPANDSTYSHYLNDGFGRLVINKCSYAVPNWDNGYNGCVDPSQFFTTATPFRFNKNLWLGMNNSDVLQLQKRLGVIQTGFFGTLTFAAVRAYQKAHNIPSTGLVGVLTRASLNE